jgi:hypothetical protein
MTVSILKVILAISLQNKGKDSLFYFSAFQL